jgi:hypothetical protein
VFHEDGCCRRQSCCRRQPPHSRSARMDDAAAKVRKLLRQQAAVAGFGSFALRQSDLMKVKRKRRGSAPMASACRSAKCADTASLRTIFSSKLDTDGTRASSAMSSRAPMKARRKDVLSSPGSHRSAEIYARTTISSCRPSMPRTGSSRPSTSSSKATTSPMAI